MLPLDREFTFLPSFMNILLGEYTCKMDPKGRVRLPSGLLDQLPIEERDQFVVSRGFEKCLYLYPRNAWEQEMVKVNNLDQFDEQSRKLQRIMYRGASPVKRDNVDRLNLPNQLLEWAGITANEGLVMAGVNNRIEIWSSSEWDAQMNISPEEMAQLAQHVMAKRSADPADPAN